MWWAEETRDKERIQAFLERDPIYAAYAIGDLEPKLFAHCRWFVATNGGEDEALGLFFTALTPHAFITMGDPDGLRTILDRRFFPTEAYFITPPEHLKALAERYQLSSTHDMIRMHVRPEDYAPAPGPAMRLTREHLDALQELYAWGNVYGFSAYQLDEGLFYGLFNGAQLVATAGTHIVAPRYGIGAVGNVFTHPHHRGKGYGSTCASAVTGALLQMGLRVVLNVAAENQGAIHVYDKLGYRQHCHFFETLARAPSDQFIQIAGERKAT